MLTCKKSSKKVLSNKSASKLVSEVRRLSGEDEIMIEFDRNSKRDVELKSEYDEMVLKLHQEYDEKYKKLNQQEEQLHQQEEQLHQQEEQLQQQEKQLQEQLKEKDIQIKNKQIEIAKNLLKNDVDTDIIISSMELTKEDIDNLK